MDQLFGSQSTGDCHGTGLAGTKSISRYCGICWESPSRARLLLPLFPVEKSSVALFKRDQIQQAVLYSARQGAVATLYITTPSDIKARMFIHSLVLVEIFIQTKDLKYSR